MLRTSLRLHAFILSFLALSACGGGGGGSSPPPQGQNVPPVALIDGPEKGSAIAGETVVLDTARSSDADGEIAERHWTQLDGPELAIDPAAAVLEFSAPPVTKDAEIVLQFEVTDDDGAKDTAETRLLIHAAIPGNVSPSAAASGHLAVRAGDTVHLDARSSTDADGGIVSFAWTQVDGPTVELADAESALATITAPAAADSDLLFRILVADDDGATDSDTVRVRVLAADANTPPQAAIAALANPVPEGTAFTLNAGTSADAEGEELSFQWTVPAGFTVEGDSASEHRLRLAGTPDVAADTSYTFLVVVSDGQLTATAATDVTVEAFNNAPGVSIETTPADITENGVNEGESVTLKATANDPDGHGIVEYTWTQLDGDVAVDTAGATGPELSFTAPDVGPEGDHYAFSVSVKDSEGEAASTEIEFDVNFVNRPPQIDVIDLAVNAIENSVVNLFVEASDPDQQALSYTWTQHDDAALSVGDIAVDPATGMATFTTPDLSAGADLHFTVTVNDPSGGSITSEEVIVSVDFVNQAPFITAAGSNSPVNEGGDVQLTVTAGDNDGHLLSYSWLQRDGEVPAVGTIAVDPLTGTGTFIAPAVPDGADFVELHFTVAVDDNNGGVAVSQEEVTVRVNRVNADPEIVDLEVTVDTVPEGAVADGVLVFTVTAADDGGTENLEYAWNVPDANFATSATNAAELVVTATPNVTADRPYVFFVTVSDGQGGATRSDDITLTVEFVNQSPAEVAITSTPADLAGGEIDEGLAITLIASGIDPDGKGPLDYTWTQTSGNTDLGIDGLEGQQLDFVTPDLPANETFTVQVTAEDVDGGTSEAAVTFTVLNIPEEPSVSISPETVQAFSGFDVTLAATVENLPGAVTYAWREVGTAMLAFDNPAAASVTFTVPDVTASTPVIVEVEVNGTAGGNPVSTLDQVAFNLEPRDAETPLPFSFTDLDAVPVARTGFFGGLVFHSNPVTIEGIAATEAPISVTGANAAYSTDGGSTFTSASGTVLNGTNVIVRVEGPTVNPGTASATLRVGQFEETFDVTGVAALLEPEGIPGGVRWSWNDGEPLQGVTSYTLGVAMPGEGTATTIATPGGGEASVEYFMPVWQANWGTGTFNSDRYDLAAVDVRGGQAIEVLGSGQLLPQSASVDAITYIKSVSPVESGFFGSTVAVNNAGDLMVVGAPAESVATGDREGRVHVYRRVENSWITVEHPQPLGGPNPGDRYGAAVALSGDGTVLAVGAPDADVTGGANAGEVHVYRLDESSGLFVLEETLRSISTANAGERFGSALALNQDGSVLAVGVPFEQSGSTDPNDETAVEAGAVYVHRHDGANWTPDRYLKETAPTAGNRFGTALALNGAGDRLFVSRTGGGRTVFVFDSAAPGEWTETAALVNAASGFGDTLSAARVAGHVSDGLRFVSGTVAYRRVGTSWTPLAIGAPTVRGTPVFSTLDPYGNLIALGVVGATATGAGVYSAVPTGAADGAGAIYVYGFSNPWFFGKFLKAPNPGTGDGFGSCMAFDGRTSEGGGLSLTRLYTCAPGEDSAGTGVHPVAPDNDMRSDDSMESAGAIYIY